MKRGTVCAAQTSIAEAAIAEATGEFQQAGGIRNHGDRNPRR